MLHKLRQQGLSVQVFETGDGVGRDLVLESLPGAGCDIESIEYSYAFRRAAKPEWKWTETIRPCRPRSART